MKLFFSAMMVAAVAAAGEAPLEVGKRVIEERLGVLGMPALNAAKTQIAPIVLAARKVTIWSLNSKDWNSNNSKTTKDYFHGRKILGAVELSAGAELTRLKRDCIEGLLPGNTIGSYYPQYGFRFVAGKKSLECVACFETLQCEWFSDGLGKRWSVVQVLALDERVRTQLDDLFDGRGVVRDFARPLENLPVNRGSSTVPP